jgi:hypothetical protein
MAFIFVGQMFSPFWSMNPKIVIEQIMNAHLFEFKLVPNPLHLKKHFLSFSIWVDMLLKPLKSSKKILMNTC